MRERKTSNLFFVLVVIIGIWGLCQCLQKWGRITQPPPDFYQTETSQPTSMAIADREEFLQQQHKETQEEIRKREEEIRAENEASIPPSGVLPDTTGP